MQAVLKKLARQFLPWGLRNFLRRWFPSSPPATAQAREQAREARARALDECRRRVATLAGRPLISIVIPTYNTPVPILDRTLASVERQIYPNWELCIVDDASSSPAVREFLGRSGERDDRIHVTRRSVNGGISACTNDGIRIATGDYVAFLDHDDELTEDALFHVACALNDNPGTDVIYSDHDKIDVDGLTSCPFFKPDWSPDYFRNVMYVCHLLVVRRALLLEVGGCDGRFDGVQDYELLLRVSEKTTRIEHLPRILYHWRTTPGSIAADPNAKRDIDDLQERAVQEHLNRLGISAQARKQGGHRVRLRPVIESQAPLISILIPSRDRPELIGPCLKSIFDQTTYEPFEVVVGDNDTANPAALALFERYPVRRIALPGMFHFSRFNNRLAECARGEYLLLLNNDTEVLQPDWLDHLLLYAAQPDAGAVGPRLIYPDGRVQHAGVILGPRGTADHVMRGFTADADGYAGSLQCTREVSAVTGACLMVRKDKYFACGGLNEFFFRHYEDVDFCLRLRRRNWRNLYVAAVTLIHHEGKTRGPMYDYTDRVLLLDYWERLIRGGDPYYNRNFDPRGTNYAPLPGVPA
jgi:GT2 family glycosyltransferase